MSRVEFIRFRFEPLGYPSARVSILPGITLGELFRSLRRDPQRHFAKECQFFVRARYALFRALSDLGAGEGDAVLIPAYHCRTIVDPVVRTGAQPLFYKVNEDLSANLEHIEAILSCRNASVIGILLPHYFGFPQPMERIMPLLDRHGVALIEDCAHVLYGRSGQNGLGAFGDYSIYSPVKFLPLPDGGILRDNSRRERMRKPLRSRGMSAEIRVFARWLAMALQRRSVPPPASSTATLPEKTRFDDEELQVRRTIDTSFLAAGRSDFYDPGLENIRGSVWSRRALDAADFDKISVARRRNFLWWVKAVAGLPCCKPLFTELDEDVVPYMFPLILEYPEPHFDNLKRSGMPIYRWDELAVSECANAAYFRLHLLQLPCHQGLTEGEREWMLETLRSSFRSNTPVR